MATPIEQIKQRLSVLDVVGAYVQLQKAGKSFKGKSPFTQERTPSFFVSPERGQYYCFSTGKGGDIFTFIQEMEGVDFKGALKILAERAGVELRPIDPKERNEREKLFAILEDATRFFEEEYTKNSPVRAYLEKRGLRDETVIKWRIGYAKPGWRNLKEFLIKKGYTETEMLHAGLLKRAEGGDASYDVFRDRVMFPILDASGRVVGFSGRIFSDDPGAPKYVNSPETELYEKSRVLFGYDKAKQGIRAYDFSLVVEGQFDLVLSHQAGYTNAVALSGTALTLAHVELLQRLSNKIVLALDADKAGIGSAKRSAEILLRRGMDVKVARIESGKDPADLVREDPKLLKHVVGNASHIVEFLLAVLKGETKDERTYRLRVREEVLPFIAIMPNHIDQEHFEHVVATELSVTKDAIRHEVTRITAGATESVSEVKMVVKEKHEGREDDLIAHLLGILLWQESEESPNADPVFIREKLEFVLGHASMQSLLDWPAERKNELIFRAEMAHGESARLKDETAHMLFELYHMMLRRRLRESHERLRGAERTEDTEARERELALAHEINETLKHTMVVNPFHI